MGFAYGVTPQFIPHTGQVNGSANPANAGPPQMTANAMVIDGTPVRVVVLAIAAAVGLTALRMGGIRFNVGVSS
jgi:hypothetical protein